MKTLTKKILYTAFAVMLFMSIIVFAALSIRKTDAKADEATLEAEFTNNGEFSITTSRWGNTYSFIDGTEVGGTGAVLQANFLGTVAGFKLDLSPMSIYSAAIESIVVRVKAANFTLNSKDEFRTIDDTSSNWVQYGNKDDLSGWFDYTLNAQSIGQFTTNGDGTIGHVNIAIRSDTSSLIMYVDSITVNISSRFNDFTNNGQFNIGTSAWNNTFSLIDGTTVDGTGAVLQVNTSAGAAAFRLDLTPMNVVKADITSIVVRLKADNFTLGKDEFRTSSNAGEPWIRYGYADDLSNWFSYTLNANSIADFTENGDGTIGYTDIVIRTNTSSLIMYVDSITVTVKDPSEKEMQTFAGLHSNASFNTLTSALLTYSGTATWNDSDDGNFKDKVTLKDSKGNLTPILLADAIAGGTASLNHWPNQKWINIGLPGTYDIIEIEEDTEYAGVLIPDMSLIFRDNTWQLLTIVFDKILSSSENSIVFKFTDDCVLTNDAGNLYSHILLNNTKLLSEDGGSVIINPSNYTITVNMVGNYSKVQFISESKIGDMFIPEICAYLNENGWGIKPLTTNTLKTVGVYGNNNLLSQGAYHTVLEFNNYFVIGGDDSTKDSTNMAASTAYDVATKVKLNGKTFYELYQENHNFYVGYMSGSRFFTFRIPQSYLDGEPENDYEYHTLEIKAGTVFMDYLLPEITIISFEKVWVYPDSFNHDTIEFTGVAPGWNCLKSGTNIDTILQFGEYGVDNLGKNADASNLAKLTAEPISSRLTINGRTINTIYNEDKGAIVSYAHGYNFLYISVPAYVLSPGYGYKCVTLHIENNTIFKNSVLGEVTLYLFNGQWQEEKINTVDDDEPGTYLTAEKIFNGTDGGYYDNDKGVCIIPESEQETTIVSSEKVGSSGVIYNLLYKVDSPKFEFTFNTYKGEQSDGVRLVVCRDEGEPLLLFNLLYGNAADVNQLLFTTDQWYALRIAVSFNGNKIIVSVAVDGLEILYINTDREESVGDTTLVKMTYGSLTFADYRSGDIEKPSFIWSGKNVYRFNAGDVKPDDSIFTRALVVTDNIDKIISDGKVEIIWQEGAVDGENKLVKGEWTVTFKVADTAGNIAVMTVKCVVSDNNKVLITFNGENPVLYNKGSLIEKPSDPIKDADETYTYEFVGWYYNDVEWDFVNDHALKDIDLEAKYIATYKEYSVAITSEYLENNFTYNFKLHYGSTIDKAIFIRDGYLFTLSCNDTVIDDIIVTSNMSVIVYYSPIGVVFDVTIVSNDIECGYVSESIVEGVPSGTQISISGDKIYIGDTVITATPSGANAQYTYSFIDFTYDSLIVSNNLTITANFTKTTNKYTVTIKSNKSAFGTVDGRFQKEVKDVEYGTSITIDGNIIKIGNTVITATANLDSYSYNRHFTYSFVDFTGATDTVEGDLTITANFTKKETIEENTQPNSDTPTNTDTPTQSDTPTNTDTPSEPSDENSGCKSEIEFTALSVYLVLIALAGILIKKNIVKGGKDHE